ncbi:MAG: hypothetical protein H0W96_12100 [Solirubrobacterales bacterium]|nr:hypothetical protein [Solirubrobacterales bacterium]
MRVTHPFHPLAGQQFEFVKRRRNWQLDRVYFFDGGGALVSLPAEWTDAVAADPFVVVAAGRSAFHVEGLLERRSWWLGWRRGRWLAVRPVSSGLCRECRADYAVAVARAAGKCQLEARWIVCCVGLLAVVRGRAVRVPSDGGA